MILLHLYKCKFKKGEEKMGKGIGIIPAVGGAICTAVGVSKQSSWA